MRGSVAPLDDCRAVLAHPLREMLKMVRSCVGARGEMGSGCDRESLGTCSHQNVALGHANARADDIGDGLQGVRGMRRVEGLRTERGEPVDLCRAFMSASRQIGRANA